MENEMEESLEIEMERDKAIKLLRDVISGDSNTSEVMKRIG